MTNKFCNISEITDKTKKDEIMASEIRPNFIHNRFDIMYKDDYLLFHIYSKKDSSVKYYIPVKIIKNTAFLGIQLTYIENKTLLDFIKYLFKNFLIWKVKFRFSLNNLAKNRCKDYFVVYLPDCIDDFNSKLSHDTRYNITRYYPKRIEKNFKYSIRHFSRQEILSNKIYETYYNFKMVTHNYDGIQNAEEYIDKNYITDAFVMYFDEKIVSIVLINILDDSAFLENLTYDVEYRNYSVGTILYYNTIKELINRNIKTFYLFDGTGEYKMRFNGTKIQTYSGTIYRYNFINSILYFFKKLFAIYIFVFLLI